MQTRTRNRTIKRTLLISGMLSGVFSLLAAFAPSAAHAGFQWVPPSQVVPSAIESPTQPGATNPPVKAVAPKPMVEMPAPLIVEGSRQPAARADEIPADTTSAMALPSSPDEMAPLPVMPKTVKSLGTLSEKAGASDTEKMVKGFASSVPLSVAMRQILPPEYGYSFAPEVNPSTLVSWKGGVTWHVAAQDMLAKAGLSMEESANSVKIIKADGGAALRAQPESVAPSLPVSAPSAIAPTVAEPKSASGDRRPLSLLPAAPAPQAAGHFLTPPPGAIPDIGVSPASMSPASQGPVIVTDSVGLDSWSAAKGETLHAVLDKWARRANVELSWSAEYDYPLQASVSFGGTFEDAVRALLGGLQDAKPQPIGTLHTNQSSGQAILVIQARGNNYND